MLAKRLLNNSPPLPCHRRGAKPEMPSSSCNSFLCCQRWYSSFFLSSHCCFCCISIASIGKFFDSFLFPFHFVRLRLSLYVCQCAVHTYKYFAFLGLRFQLSASVMFCVFRLLFFPKKNQAQSENCAFVYGGFGSLTMRHSRARSLAIFSWLSPSLWPNCHTSTFDLFKLSRKTKLQFVCMHSEYGFGMQNWQIQHLHMKWVPLTALFGSSGFLCTAKFPILILFINANSMPVGAFRISLSKLFSTELRFCKQTATAA